MSKQIFKTSAVPKADRPDQARYFQDINRVFRKLAGYSTYREQVVTLGTLVDLGLITAEAAKEVSNA